MTCLFWVQSLLGSGHLRRALAIAGALARDGQRVILANGGLPSPWPAPAGVQIVQLSPVTSGDVAFAILVQADGRQVDETLWAKRRQVLLDLLAEHRPRVLLTEMFPFGRRAFRAELLPLLDLACEQGALVLASVRDVLVTKRDPAKYDWMLDLAQRRYDAVLVHGDPLLFPFALSFPHADRLTARVLYTGFVLDDPDPRPAPDAPAVVVSAGGGAVGAGLLAAAIQARPLTRLAREPWLLVGGSNLPPEHQTDLARHLPPGVELVRHRPDLPQLTAGAQVSVSQAGYNTVAEGLAGGARMVLVPFAAGGEDEQTRRALRLVELGLAEHLPEHALSPPVLAAAIGRALLLPRPEPGRIRFDGAARAAALVREMIRDRA
jgi:predicted glycosyltransferase